jgi:protoporphyrinogen oxidase
VKVRPCYSALTSHHFELHPISSFHHGSYLLICCDKLQYLSKNRMNSVKSVIVIGAGPAGLTAAYILAKAGIKVTVLEADSEYVGGISRTVRYKGFGFDIGGHRFFSKSKEIEDLWNEILPDDMLTRPRNSRIYYRKKFFSYPLHPLEALFKLGFMQSFLCICSYVRARLIPIRNPENFEEWVINQFGRRLFRIFFKTYTEKVWGITTKEISADWAAQRIKGLSLSSAVLSALGFWRKGNRIKTLISSFRYPRQGPGMLWEAATRKIRMMGGRVILGYCVTALDYLESGKKWKVTAKKSDADEVVFTGSEVISSAPLREIVGILSARLPQLAKDAALSLRYRDFLRACLESFQ